MRPVIKILCVVFWGCQSLPQGQEDNRNRYELYERLPLKNVVLSVSSDQVARVSFKFDAGPITATKVVLEKIAYEVWLDGRLFALGAQKYSIELPRDGRVAADIGFSFTSPVTEVEREVMFGFRGVATFKYPTRHHEMAFQTQTHQKISFVPSFLDTKL